MLALQKKIIIFITHCFSMDTSLETVFQDKVDKEIKIEPKDWMPEK